MEVIMSKRGASLLFTVVLTGMCLAQPSEWTWGPDKPLGVEYLGINSAQTVFRGPGDTVMAVGREINGDVSLALSFDGGSTFRHWFGMGGSTRSECPAISSMGTNDTIAFVYEEFFEHNEQTLCKVKSTVFGAYLNTPAQNVQDVSIAGNQNATTDTAHPAVAGVYDA
jgi:hypothetical protein